MNQEPSHFEETQHEKNLMKFWEQRRSEKLWGMPRIVAELCEPTPPDCK